MGLLKDDVEWKKENCEAFASSFVTLTNLYETIIAYREPVNAKDIWDS